MKKQLIEKKDFLFPFERFFFAFLTVIDIRFVLVLAIVDVIITNLNFYLSFLCCLLWLPYPDELIDIDEPLSSHINIKSVIVII